LAYDLLSFNICGSILYSKHQSSCRWQWDPLAKIYNDWIKYAKRFNILNL
jgi:hypothetical protein